MFRIQDSQEHNSHNRSPNSSIKLKGQNETAQDPVSAQVDGFKFDENSQRLEIRGGIVVNSFKFLLQMKSKNSVSITQKKKNGVNTKIHSIQKDVSDVNSNAQQNQLNELDQKVFSIKKYTEQLKNSCSEIIIQDSRVNMYALKKLVRIASQNVTNLRIHNCKFYEGDNSTIQDGKVSTNNKMLRELSFAFQIKSLQLPQIASLEIILLQQSNEVEVGNESNNNTIPQQGVNEDSIKEILAKKYNCNADSSFVEFEVKDKSQVEQNINKYKSQQEMVNYIIHGDLSYKKHIEDSINNNIIIDIQEHIHAFIKYIKESLINKNTFLIKGYCLEDPIALNMVQNAMIKNKNIIKTVVFKETGTIPNEIFFKVITLLDNMSQLESIAFFDSQPSFEPKSYLLLKELNDLKKFKYFVLNRSSFDLTGYQNQVQQEDNNKQNIFNNKKVFSHEINPIPQHYAFYILDAKDKTKELYEFTPYNFCVNNLLYPEQMFTNENQKEEAILKYKIGHLLKKQRDEYPIQINHLIEIFHNQQLLTYNGIIEQIFSKYTIGEIDKGQVELNQIELENDIRTLIKHANYYSISLAKQILNKLTSKTDMKSFKFQCNLFKEDTYTNQLNFKELNNIFLKQQSLNPHIIEGYICKKQFLSNGFPIKSRKFVSNILTESSTIERLQKIDHFDIEKLIKSMNRSREIMLNFQQKSFIITSEFDNKFVQEIRALDILRYDFKDAVEMTYLNQDFLNVLEQIFQKCNKYLSLCYSIEDDTQLNICLSHLELFKKLENKKLQELIIFGKGESFKLEQIFSLFQIKSIILINFCFDNASFSRKMCPSSIEIINLNKCVIKSIDLSYFNNLKEINMKECEMEESVIQKLLFEKKIQPINSPKNPKLLVCLDLKEKEMNVLAISKELITQIIKNEACNEFAIILNKVTSDKFSEEISASIPSKLNYHLLQKFQGNQNNAHHFQLEEENQKLEKTQNQSNFLETNYKSKANNKLGFIMKTEEENKIKEYHPNFQNIIQTYTNIHAFDIQAELLQYLTHYEQKQICDKFISNCCKNTLEQIFKSKDIDMQLLEEIKNHNDEFCLLRTSVFQMPFKPKSIQIKFFKNCLINSNQFLNYEKMEWIEEIDIRSQLIEDYLQLKFIDLLIQLSPRLQKLVFKRTLIQNRQNIKQPIFTPFLSHKELKHLEIPYCSNDLSVSIIQAALNSEFLNLESLNLFEHESDSLYIMNIAQIIQRSKNTLKILKIDIKSQEQFDNIKACTNLEKLTIQCNEKNICIESIQAFQSINSLTINLVTPYLRQKIIDTLFNFALKNQSINLQQITIKYEKQETQVKFNKRSFYQSSREKWPSFNTYYLEKSCHNNNNTHQQYLIILINQYIDFGLQSEDQEENINQKIYVLENYGQTIKELSFSQIQSNLTIFSNSSLQELHINQQISYNFINKVFEVCRNSLLVVSFDECNLDNNSLNGVDFSRLPSSIRRLCIGGNNKLTSLAFLEPILLKREQYQNMILDVNTTQIPLQQILKFLPYLKRIDHQQIKLWELLNYQISQMNWNIDQQVNIIQTIKSMVIDNSMDKSEILILFKLFFHSKLPDQTLQRTYPYFFTPLQIMQKSISLNAKEDLQKIYAKQKEDDLFSLKQQFGNKYLFYICQLINESDKFILSYSKNYHDNYFHVGKLRDRSFKLENEANLDDKEHIFFDYLLLLQLHEQYNLKQVILPISLEVSRSLLINKKINTSIDELTIAEHFSQIPPSELIIDNMSIQFIKTWYVISTIYPLSFKTQIQNIDSDAIYNNSIGNYLTQNLHRNNFLRSILSGTSRKYRFDETVQFLAQHLQDQIVQNKQTYLLLLFPFYQFVCMFGVIFFSLHFEVTCGKGISWYSYYSYLIYGFITLWIELLLFKKCLNYISHLIPSLEIDLNPNFIISFINFIKQSIIDTPWINQWYMGYSYSFFQSQIARFDNFTNVGFLYSTYQCGDYTIFYIALSSMSIPFLYSIFQFFRLIFKPNKKYSLPTASLDTYYNICNIIEFRAVSDILDLVSPSNVITLKGRMFNARIISYFIRIVCESMPLVIIQIYNLTKITMTSSLIVSLILSIITFLSLTISVLTITPSTLNQEDFNQLSEKKKKDRVAEKYEERLSTVENEIFVLRFYDHLKKLRINYLNQQKQGQISQELENQYKQNEKYFEKLFDSPKESLLNLTNEGENN